MLSLAPVSSTEGHVVLSWQLPAGLAEGVLQMSVSPGFGDAGQAPLEFPVNASGTLVHTGLTDGRYYFRVGVPGRWSAVHELDVRHHALPVALFCFALGLAVFAVLVGVILHGSRQHGAADA